MPKIEWPLAWIAIAALGAVVGLVALGQDLKTIGLFLSGAATTYLAYRQVMQGRAVEEVKTLANGNLARRDEENARLKEEATARERDFSRIIAQLVNAAPQNTPLPQQLRHEEPNAPDKTVVPPQ